MPLTPTDVELIVNGLCALTLERTNMEMTLFAPEEFFFAGGGGQTYQYIKTLFFSALAD